MGEPEMVALQTVADGTPIVLNVSSVTDSAGGRGVADQGYSRLKVSCNMIKARDQLNIIQTKNRNNPAWKNRHLYRLLYNPTLHILAYERIKSKPGNMTRGADGKTLDGYSMEAIEQQIELLRTEQYKPKPVRRVYIPKGTGTRPLGMPSPRDKIIQECLRLILEAIYEPNFHDNSHGFRPGRSCHTALQSLRRNWVGTKWVVKIDIAACFDRIDHHRLLDILREKICDDRFINLIRKFLTAGYLEDWRFHKTYSGTPQGSIISPILSNIYLDKLDRKLAQLCQQHSRGRRRRASSRRASLMKQRKQLLIQGESRPDRRDNLCTEIRALNHEILRTPAYLFNDPAYTRVKFLRYADDVAVGIIGSKSLATQLTDEIADFLQSDLKLELNREKTTLSYTRTDPTPFLGYLFRTASPRYRRRNLRRKGSPHNVVQTVKTTTGNIKLLVPLRQLSLKLDKYMANGQPTSFNALINQPTDHIIAHYNAVIRGWYYYYQLAENVGRLNYARYVLLYSLAKTLAHKEGSSVWKIFRKYGNPIRFVKPNGRLIQFFNQPLKQSKSPTWEHPTIDVIPTWFPRRTQSRLQDNCAICASTEQIEMHHVRHIRKRGQHLRGFHLYLASVNRKQIPVCHRCHLDIHQGRYDGSRLSDILARIHARRSESFGSSTQRGSPAHGLTLRKAS